MRDGKEASSSKNMLKGVLIAAAVLAVVSVGAYLINVLDIGFSQELEAGEKVVIMVDNEAVCEVGVYSARFLSETEAISMQADAKGQTLVAVEMHWQETGSFDWGVNHMRVRDGKGKYGEVVAIRGSDAICRIQNPTEQISFFIYADNWTKVTSPKASGRYKLAVSPAPEDPAQLVRAALDAGQLAMQALTMELEDGFAYTKHYADEEKVWLEYADMDVHVEIYTWDMEMDIETLIKSGSSRIAGGLAITEPSPAPLENDTWHYVVTQSEDDATATYFAMRGQTQYTIGFSVEGSADNLDFARINAMMETAALHEAND